MSVIRRLPLCLAALTIAALLLPRGAGAFYGNGFDASPGAFLVSADYARLEQGDDTTRFAAISASGRYVAIETFARNFFADNDPDPPGAARNGGIFRFDLATRALQKVADGNLFEDGGAGAFLSRGAFNPSINADGRYVAFSTAAPLVAADANENVDVYVRDMNLALPAGGQCTIVTGCPFELVSARAGGSEAATYDAPATQGGNPGASSARGVAISADGRRVVFRTEAPSNLPAQPGVETPAGQVLVRDLDAQSTALVTALRDAGTELMTAQPAGGAIGAAISADGSTVAWTGSNAAAQTRFLGGENTDPTFYYYLWRRAPFGPGEPTRRITGLADPDDPVCRSLEEENPGMTTTFIATATGPCYGPLTDRESVTDITSQLPVLSGDGRTVAFLTAAGPRPNAVTGLGFDLYTTRMDAGLSRKQATTELTRDTANSGPAIGAPITGLAMSSDGRFLAVTSSRTQFVLPTLQLLGQPRAVPGPRELYLIDLQQHTIERAARSVASEDIDAEVFDGVSLSAEGSRIAFASFAGNLFRGDANQRADAFVVTREPEPTPSGTGIDAALRESSVRSLRRRRISVRLRSMRDGIAVLGVSVPAAGRVEAIARRTTGSDKLAEGQGRATRKSVVPVTLRLPSPLRAELRAGERIEARTKVIYDPTGSGRSLRTSLKLIFFSKSSPLRHK